LEPQKTKSQGICHVQKLRLGSAMRSSTALLASGLLLVNCAQAQTTPNGKSLIACKKLDVTVVKRDLLKASRSILSGKNITRESLLINNLAVDEGYSFSLAVD